MKTKLLWSLVCLLAMSAVPVQAQFSQDTLDLGVADTVDLVFSVTPCLSTGQLEIQVDLYVFNDSNTLIGGAAGFVWDNPNLQMDSAVGSPMLLAAWDIGPFFYEDDDINITNANQHFMIGGAKITYPGVQTATTRQLWASYYFTLSGWTISDSIVIDTLKFNDGSTFKLVGEGNKNYIPYWTGKKTEYDCDYTPPSNLVLTPDSLYFTGMAGGSSPPSQPFLVSSDGDPLDFNIVESISWAIPSPIQGTTARTITVLTNTVGMPAGTYIDSLKVESAQADNSPQYVKLVMYLEEPPPVIGVTPTAFYFNAIAGESDPPVQTLTVTNEGASTLNWSLSHSESWLGLAPGSGVDSADVTVSVSITGLPFGQYLDTIVVSDPVATNDPVKVPVTLNVASDLPVIAVDSGFFYVVVTGGVFDVPPRHVLISNDGGGAMNFWLEENSARLFTLNPDSGTAPQSVEVGFKITGGTGGVDYYDTLWVYSNEAINSPIPVVFLFHYIDDPAELYVSYDIIQLNVFECDMGAGVGMPGRTFFVNNIGGDNPLPFQLIYESIYFTVSHDSGVAPFGINVTAMNLQLPLGTYYDTIYITAEKAVNSPQTVVVQFNMVAGLNQPEIYLSKDSYVIPIQENAGPILPSVFEVLNRFGGCMPWEIQEDVPWLTPDPDSGNVHGESYLRVDAPGYLIGEYAGSFLVVAPTATNSPQQVDLLLRVWRFHGDWNYDGEINVGDLVMNIDWLFRSGPDPEPERIVGDLDCSHIIDVGDLSYFVAYLFQNGPIPCGNPYKKH